MTITVNVRIAAIGILCMAMPAAAFAEEAATMDTDSLVAMSQSADEDAAKGRAQFRSLDEDVQSLKKEVLDLNRDLFLLEEELLFPANSQVAFLNTKSQGLGGQEDQRAAPRQGDAGHGHQRVGQRHQRARERHRGGVQRRGPRDSCQRTHRS